MNQLFGLEPHERSLFTIHCAKGLKYSPKISRLFYLESCGTSARLSETDGIFS